MGGQKECSTLRLSKACGLVIRPVEDADFAQILEIAKTSFPIPENWATERKNRVLYEPNIQREMVDGILRVVVAEHIRDSFLAGYCYYQLRNNGDVYLVELAASPPQPEHKIRMTGSLLLCFALEETLANQCHGQATVNIVAHGPDEVPAGLADKWRNSEQFYERFGYKRQEGVVGYRMTKTKPAPNSRWMTADIHEVATRAIRYLAAEISDKSANIV